MEQGIFFGLNRENDERSLKEFLDLFCKPEMKNALIPRLTEEEITGLVDHMTDLMRRHFSENEYHRLFLGEEHHH